MHSNLSSSSNVSISKLEEVFATFNRVSADLGSNYRELEVRVAGLSEELAVSHTARIKELSAKEQLAAKLSALMEALPGGVIVLSARGIVREENASAVKLLGKSQIGQQWNSTLDEVSACDSQFENEISLHDGKRISINTSSFGDEDETIILLTDVTENFRLNNQVNREKRLSALGEMSARLAHQVRTPLSAAILYLSHLSFGEDEKSLLTSKKISSRLNQIESLVDGMLSYIRGEANSANQFSLNKLIFQLRESFSAQLELCEGQLHIAVPLQNCLMWGDEQAMQNAVGNLIENAMQAVPNEPIIQLSLHVDRGIYRICVEDNGPGVDESIKEQVFDPFFSTRNTGTGLGLAVVASVTKAHNGELTIGNSSHGGAAFELLIPRKQKSANEESGIWDTETQQLDSNTQSGS